MKTLTKSKHQELIDEDPDYFYRNASDGAQRGTISDALELLHGFRDSYVYEKPLPRAVGQYLYEAVDQYLKHHSEQKSADDQARLLHKALLLH